MDPAEKTFRGITKRHRPDRPSPYGVQWYVEGKARREFFKKEDDRDRRYAGLIKQAERGQIAEALPRSQIAQARAFFQAIGSTPWQDVVAGWRRQLAADGATPCELNVKQAVAKYLAHVQTLLESESISPDTVRHKRSQLQRFSDAFGATKLDKVTPEAIEGWIDDLGFEADGTFNSYRKQVQALFQFHRRIVKNPVEHIEVRGETIDSVGILTVEQTGRLFRYAHHHCHRAIGRLALEAFAGLRFASAVRIEKADINFDDHGITLPAKKIKDGRRHYLDGLPHNLWTWLGCTDSSCWTMSGSDWMHVKTRLFESAGIPHPRNCLRHSFCTYHVAAYKNPGLTATILCHRDQEKLWTNYNGIAKVADGRDYFRLTPQSVERFAP